MEYFASRALEREAHWNDVVTRELEEKVKLYYASTLEAIYREIAALYGKYADENGLSMQEARRLIRGSEYKVWRMTLEEYVEAARYDTAILKELNTLAMRSRISRYEKLMAETLKEINELCYKTEDIMTALMSNAYADIYYRTLYDVHKGYGLKTAPVVVDSKRIEGVLRTKWSGANYSERIWVNGRKLETAIERTVLSGIHRGLSIEKLSRGLSREMEVGYNNAERLVRTELNFVQNKAALDSIESAGLDSYQFLAALDRRTCPVCGSLDSRIFKLEEYNQGETAPPMHARCRCTICASIDGVKRRSRIAERREKIPGNVTYEKWKSRYVDKATSLSGVTAGLNEANHQSSNASKRSAKNFPVLKCRNFEELKTYWSDNYNVKIGDELSKLHFETVRQAMGGIEAVIKEFEPAVAHLKEMRLLEVGLMSTVRGKGVINFNPEYFSDMNRLLDELNAGAKVGYYHKNMSVLSVGAHEAGHILEDWLIAKSGDAKDVSLRIVPRKIVREAYKHAIQTVAGKGKTIGELKNQICTHALKENNSECLADAISDYITNGSNAALISIEIWRTLKGEMIK